MYKTYKKSISNLYPGEPNSIGLIDIYVSKRIITERTENLASQAIEYIFPT